MSSQTHIERISCSKKEVRKSYDRISTLYDIIASSERKYNEMGVRQLKLAEGDHVLEIGFGTGHCLISMAQMVGSTGIIYGLDISIGMSRRAQKKIQDAGLSQSVLLTMGDAAHLPFQSRVFDAILMTFTLELFDTPEIPAVLNECLRVLRLGGRMCVVALSQRKGGNMVTLYEWAHRLFPHYIDCRPIYVQESIENTQFQVIDTILTTMWGLPLEIVLAEKL